MVLRVLRVSLSSVLAVHVSTAIESSWPRAANTSIAFFSLGCEMLWNSKYEHQRRSLTTSLKYYPVVIITCVHYLFNWSYWGGGVVAAYTLSYSRLYLRPS